MAENNNNEDQDKRSWGEKMRQWFNEETTGRKEKLKEVKNDEELVRKLKKHKRP